MTNFNISHRLARRALARVAAGGVLLLGSLTACSPDEILTIEDPDVVQLEALTTLTSLPAVRAAVIGDFQVAYAGSNGNEGIAQFGGLLGDELQNAESFPTRIEIDMRNIQLVNATLLGTYRSLHRARAVAEVASARYTELAPTNQQRGEMLSLGGYTYLAFAENYCSGVPFSNVDLKTAAFTYGKSETTTEMLQRAIAKYDSAITVTAVNTTNSYLARVGKARAQLSLNDYAGAAATVGANGAVNAVPSNFAYYINHSENSSRQNNGIFIYSQNQKRFTIADREGLNGLPYRSEGATEPRLMVYRPAGSAGNGFTASVPLFVSWKYPDRKAPFRLASGVEARLIEAEAALRVNDLATFLVKLNEARANAPTFAPGAGTTPPAKPAPLTAADIPVTAAGREDLLFKERAYHLFLEGHRLSDLRRLVRQYGRGSETVFPTGNYFRGGVYGLDKNFPIPFEEVNNPEYRACINRDA